MPQNFERRFFDHPSLFVFASRRWRRESVSECLREARDHRGIVTCKVVQLDRFSNAVVCL